MTHLVVEQAGPRTVVEDAGRPGWAHLGISGSGAWDRAAYRRGARLVGNPDGIGCLEILLGPVRLRCCGGPVMVAVTGADAEVRVDGIPRPSLAGIVVGDGQVVEVSVPRLGLRSYLSVSGGVEVPAVFGSVSSDPTRGMGPAPLRNGQALAVGGAEPRALHGLTHDVPEEERAQDDGALVLHGLWGPREDWFTAPGRKVLVSTTWHVDAASDRVGTRLVGPALERAVQGELTSEPVVRGAIQVPNSGVPLVFGPDHPTTGGYPVIGVVDGPDADRLAQAAPGTPVRFIVE